jgi:hypothetical protein
MVRRITVRLIAAEKGKGITAMAGALSGLSDFITTLAGFTQNADLDHHDNIGLRVMRETKCVARRYAAWAWAWAWAWVEGR